MPIDVQRYLTRIGLVGPVAPDRDTLARVVAAHTRTIPFENLDPLRGRPVDLDPDALQAKLVDGGRGGYCFEHNGVLLSVLHALGYRAVGLGARVVWGAAADAVTARTHMVIAVELGGDEVWHVDVGFGGQTPTAPLRRVPDVVQATPHEPYRFTQGAGDWLLEALTAGEWRAMYRFDLVPQHPIDYALSNWWTSTHPTSHFTTTLVAARAAEDRRYNLRGTAANGVELAEHFPDGRTVRRRLTGAAEVVEVLRDPIGLTVPADPRLDEVLTRLAG